MNTCPTQNYYGLGPLTRDEVQQCAKVMNEIGRYATDKGVKIGFHNEFLRDQSAQPPGIDRIDRSGVCPLLH